MLSVKELENLLEVVLKPESLDEQTFDQCMD